ncbi:MAG TPA: hypothetical protein PKO32_02270 [Syntrophomonadaceae bacterium]|nr:hypothetical protein [Syntrophomonadaceae bacterium]HQA06851.1 hypothetical protein [Syntrophomonadaceae bacterium]
MTKELAERIEYYARQLPVLQACHQAVQESYPGLGLRWTKIYGRRWSHVWGDGTSMLSAGRRVQINESWGMVLNEPCPIPEPELTQMVQVLKNYLK